MILAFYSLVISKSIFFLGFLSVFCGDGVGRFDLVRGDGAGCFSFLFLFGIGYVGGGVYISAGCL